MTSWIFIAILLFLLSNLAMITIHAYHYRKQARLEIHPESRGAMAGSICRFSRKQ